MKKLSGLLILLLSSMTAWAMPVYTVVPANIQNCIDSGSCFLVGVEYVAAIDGNQIIAYGLQDFRSGSVIDKVLIEYQVGAASNIETFDEYTGIRENTSITGSVWLELNRSYSLSESLHNLSLHFDLATPSTVATVWDGSPENELDLLISSEGLLAGQGNASAYCCDGWDEPAPLPAPTSLFDSNGFGAHLCLAEGCFAEATLNLLGLQYINADDTASLTYNPDEMRKLLYSSAEGFEGYTRTTYTPSRVPVPAALPLFIVPER